MPALRFAQYFIPPFWLFWGLFLLFFVKVSGNHIDDTVGTYAEAENICRAEGGRLLQIRAKEILDALSVTRFLQFSEAGEFLEFYGESLVALGMKYNVDDDYPGLIFR